jgi:RimJ/RimL family protein N-acetyltransferase
MPAPLPYRLETERLLLREPLPGDAAAIYAAYATDPDVCRYTTWTPHESVETVRRFVEGCIERRQSGTVVPYLVTERGTGATIGMLDARLGSHLVDIGFVLARGRWGEGLMPEAISAVTEAALASPEIFRVQATCDVENAASARALEKAGFSREGRLARHTVMPNLSPEPRDCLMYARCR